jgi:hypothetical protein
MSAAAVKAQDVLDKLDQKAFGFFHVKMIVVCNNSFLLFIKSNGVHGKHILEHLSLMLETYLLFSLY